MDVDDFGYMLFDSSLLIILLSTIGKCKHRTSNINVVYDVKAKQGLCNLFRLKCTKVQCKWTEIFATNRTVNKQVQRGKAPYGINIRTVAAFREIGKGFAVIETFCGIMNMPQPMNRTTFRDCIDSMHPAYVNTAEHSMNNAALPYLSSLQI